MKKILKSFSLNRMHIHFLFITGFITFASSTVVSYMNSEKLYITEQEISAGFKNIADLHKIHSTLSDAESGRRGYFITGDQEFLETFQNSSTEIDTIYTRLRKSMSSNSSQLANLDRLSSLVKERFELFRSGINLQNKKGSSIIIHKSIIDKGKDIQSQIKGLLEQMKKEEEKSISSMQEITGKSSRFTLIVMLGGAVVSGLIFLFGYLIQQQITSHSYLSANSEKMSPEELEEIVRHRTAELAELNRKLYRTIDEYKKTQTALQESEEFYRTLFEQAHDAIIIFDPDDEKVIEVNGLACDLYQFNKEEFIGLSMRSLSKNIPESQENVRKTLEHGYNNFQTVHYRKDNNEMLIEINSSVFQYKGRKAILSINRDITERLLSIKL